METRIEVTEERRSTIKASQLMRVSEAAKVLGIHRATLYRWISEGRVVITPIGKMLFVSSSEVDKIKEGGEK